MNATLVYSVPKTPQKLTLLSWSIAAVCSEVPSLRKYPELKIILQIIVKTTWFLSCIQKTSLAAPEWQVWWILISAIIMETSGYCSFALWPWPRQCGCNMIPVTLQHLLFIPECLQNVLIICKANASQWLNTESVICFSWSMTYFL